MCGELRDRKRRNVKNGKEKKNFGKKVKERLTARLLLEHHCPKVLERVGQWRLSGNESTIGAEIGVDVSARGELHARLLVGENVGVAILLHVRLRAREFGTQRIRELCEQYKVLRNGRVVRRPRNDARSRRRCRARCRGRQFAFLLLLLLLLIVIIFINIVFNFFFFRRRCR
jgi:hypothetical protein